MPAIEPPLEITESYIGDPSGVYTYAVESNKKHIYLCEIQSAPNAVGGYDWSVICQTHRNDNLVASGMTQSVKESVEIAKDMARSFIERRR